MNGVWDQLALSNPIQRVPRRSAKTPTSKSHLTHALSHSHAHISSDIIIVLISISDIQLLLFVRARNRSSPVLTPLLAPLHRYCKASAPRCFALCGQKEDPCGAVDFTLHINSPVTPRLRHHPQLTVFSCLVVGCFLTIYFHLQPTIVATAAAVNPPLHQYSLSNNAFHHNSSGSSSRPPRCLPLWVWISPSRPIPSLPGSPLHLSLHSLPPDHHLQQSYIQCMRKSGLNERL